MTGRRDDRLGRPPPAWRSGAWLAAYGTWAALGLFMAARAYRIALMGGSTEPFLVILLSIGGAMMLMMPLGPFLHRRALGQPPFARSPLAFLAANVPVALVLPAIHAVAALALDNLFRGHGATLLRYYIVYFDIDLLAFLSLLGSAQVSVHLQVTQKERAHQARIASDLARAEVEAARLLTQPGRYRSRLRHLRMAITETPARAEAGVVLLGDFLRLSLRATGRPRIPLEEESAVFRADRMFFSALRGESAALEVRVGAETAAAAVPNGLLLSLLDESMIHERAGTGGRTCWVRANLVDDRLRIDVTAHRGDMEPGSGRPLDEGSVQTRLARLFSTSRLTCEPLPGGFVRCRIEVPFLTEAGSRPT